MRRTRVTRSTRDLHIVGLPAQSQPSGVVDPRRMAASHPWLSATPTLRGVPDPPQGGDAMRLDSFTTVRRFKHLSADVAPGTRGHPLAPLGWTKTPAPGASRDP